MFEYIAKPWHVVMSILVLVLGSAIMAFTKHWSWLVAGVGTWVMGFGLFFWMVYVGTHDSRVRYFDAIARLGQTIAGLDQDTRNALGIRFPELRMRFRGEASVYLEDTDILMSYFYEFMRRSTEREIVPERLYGDGTIARKQWFMWRDWLIENHYVIPNSHAGNHSWLFYGGAKKRLVDRYGYGPKLADFGEAEFGSNQTNTEYVDEPKEPLTGPAPEPA